MHRCEAHRYSDSLMASIQIVETNQVQKYNSSTIIGYKNKPLGLSHQQIM